MSLPNVTFTNNLGTLSFQRCLLSVTDSWEYNGRVVRHVKSIGVDGYIQQGGVGEGYQGIITNTGKDGARFGDQGSLQLPWTTLNSIRLVDFDLPPGPWINMTPVRATFADDFPDLNSYTITFFGLTVYNPRITLPIAIRGLHDDYPQMRMTNGQFLFGDPLNGVFRNRSSQKNMELVLSGSVRVIDNQLPTNLMQTLIQRTNMSPPAPGPVVFNQLPTGYPRVFNLGDAIPEIARDMNLAHVFITGASFTWHVEEQMFDLNVQLMCPPQIITRS